MNAVETDKDVIIMVSMDVEDVVELWTCSKKNVVRTWSNQDAVRT